MWVTIAPSAKGFGKALNGQVKGEVSGSGVGKSITDAIGGAFKAGGAVAATAAGLVTAAMGKIVKSGISFNKSMQLSAAQFEVLTGSAEGAAKMLGVIQGIKLTSPFEKGVLANATAELLQFGIEATDVEDRLRRLGDASGGNAQSLATLTRVYGQVQSSGRLMGGQINQLINAGFNPFSAVVHATGLTLEQAQAEFEATADQAAWLSLALELATSEGGMFYGMMETMNQTVYGSFGNLTDTFKVFSGEFVGGINGPIMGSLSGFAQSIEKGWKSLLDLDDATGLYTIQSEGLARALEFVSNIIDNVGKAIGNFISTAGRKFFNWLDTINFNNITSGLDTVQGLIGPLVAVSTTFLSGWAQGLPYIGKLFPKVTGPIGIVLGIVTQMWRESEILRDAVMDLVRVAIDGFSGLSPVIELVSTLTGTLAGIMGDLLGNAIRTVIPLIENIFSNLLVPLLPVLANLADMAAFFAGVIADALFQSLESILPALMAMTDQLFPLLVNLLTVLTPLIEFLAGVAVAGLQIAFGLLEVPITVVATLLTGLFDILNRLLGPIASLFGGIRDEVTETESVVGTSMLNIENTVDAGANSIAAAGQDGFGGFYQAAADYMAETEDRAEEFYRILTGQVEETTNKVVDIWDDSYWEQLNNHGVWQSEWLANQDTAYSRALALAEQSGSEITAAGLTALREQFENENRAAQNRFETERGNAERFAAQNRQQNYTLATQQHEMAAWMWDETGNISSEAQEAINAEATRLLGRNVEIQDEYWQTTRRMVQAEWENTIREYTNGTTSVASAVEALPPQLRAALGDTGQILFNSGAEVMNGFIAGLESQAPRAFAAISRITGRSLPPSIDDGGFAPLGIGVEATSLADTMSGIARSAAFSGASYGLGSTLAGIADRVTSSGGRDDYVTLAQVEALLDALAGKFERAAERGAAGLLDESARHRAVERPGLRGAW